MRKGLPQVAKSASKVAKKGPRWTHFGPGGVTFEASRAIFGVPWRLFAHFLLRFQSFCVKLIFFNVIFLILRNFPLSFSQNAQIFTKTL